MSVPTHAEKATFIRSAMRAMHGGALQVPMLLGGALVPSSAVEHRLVGPLTPVPAHDLAGAADTSTIMHNLTRQENLAQRLDRSSILDS